MDTMTLPPRTEMLRAFMERDPQYEGVFLTGVTTTGIVCRPTCPARKPRPENVVFFPDLEEALAAGYRPCRRCRPLRLAGAPPDWLAPLLEAVEVAPDRRWTDGALEDEGFSPTRVRRWFRKHHGTTFHAWARARRLAEALDRIQSGEGVSRAAFGTGWDSLSGFGEAFRSVLGRTPGGAADETVVRFTRLLTPLGPMLAGATDDAVVLLEFGDRASLERQVRRLAQRTGWVFAPGRTGPLDDLEPGLTAFLEGRGPVPDVPVRTPGTDFQQEVWRALRAIPAGTTRSYGEVAEGMGRPGAARAVATAIAANRVAVLVPCHRVVGADGSLTGYAGGLWRKRRLLELERRAGRETG